MLLIFTCQQQQHVRGDLCHRLVVEPEGGQEHLHRLLHLGVERLVRQLRVDKDAQR